MSPSRSAISSVDKFSGISNQDYGAWKTSVKMALEVDGCTDERLRIINAGTTLSGNASAYFKSLYDADNLPDTLDALFDALKVKYAKPMVMVSPMVGNDVTSYLARFNNLVKCVTFASVEDEFQALVYGLSPSLKTAAAVIGHQQGIDTLKQRLAEVALSLPSSEDHIIPTDESSAELSAFYASNRGNNKSISRRSWDSYPSHWPDWKKAMASEGRCFLCFQPGHRSELCPDGEAIRAHRHQQYLARTSSTSNNGNNSSTSNINNNNPNVNRQ